MLFPLLLLAATVCQADGQQRPNILIAISDDQSYPHASAYGSQMVRTPAFDRVAQSGALFTRALVASPGCSPSRAAFLTGKYPWQLESAGTHASGFPHKFDTFPSQLEAIGYHVGYTGKGWGPGNWQASGRKQNPAGPEWNKVRLARGERAGGISSTDYAGNFKEFLAARDAGQPFCFWYGAHEPHRKYEEGSGLAAGKTLDSAEVPGFLPDAPEVRGDLLDYALEIEWFDQQLAKMLRLLEEAGELDNTLIVVTADNGMPFPRAKANCYEYGVHVPLAIAWPRRFAAGQRFEPVVSLVDVTATIRAATGIANDNATPTPGKSLLGELSRESSADRPERTYVYSARERHSSSRYENVGYPQRAVRSQDYLYIRNFKPRRWPAGDPQELLPGGKLGPMHGAYRDIDASPTLALLVERRGEPAIGPFLEWAVAKRPAEELFCVKDDPACLHNLVDQPAHAKQLVDHRAALDSFLRETGDPRAGDEGEVFETYPRYSPLRKFPRDEESARTHSDLR